MNAPLEATALRRPDYQLSDNLWADAGSVFLTGTQAIIGDEVSLILLSAPDAMSYYPTLGFELAQNAYVIRRKR